MKILLTGGSGMVGRNVLDHPRFREAEMLCPSSLELDLLEREATHAYLRAHKPDVVLHAAGKVGGIQANMREPVAFLVDNLTMGTNLLMAARAAGVEKLLNLGSSCMYPRDAPNPLTEDLLLTGTLEPTNEGYAIAKCATCRLGSYITREDPRFQYKTVIPCNLYGPWDKFDPAHSHLLPAIIEKIVAAQDQGLESVEIWGDGEVRREFLYAGDLAAFLAHAVDHFEDLETLTNVGAGFDLSVNEYYQAVAEAVGYQGEFVHDLSKPTGMEKKLMDVSRARRLGWEPETSLAEGIEKTVAYFRGASRA